MGAPSIKLDQIGESRILSKEQRKWLNGDDTALQGTPDRKIRSRIRRRVDSAFTELRFIHERMSPEELAEIGRNGDGSVIGTMSQPLDPEVAPNLHGSARTMAATAGMDDSMDMVSEGMASTDEKEGPEKMVANVIGEVFQRAGYSEEEYPEVWTNFSDDVERHLID